MFWDTFDRNSIYFDEDSKKEICTWLHKSIYNTSIYMFSGTRQFFFLRNYGGHPGLSPNLKLGSDILIAGPIHLWCLCDPVVTSHDQKSEIKHWINKVKFFFERTK
jgi:hypothetical protein